MPFFLSSAVGDSKSLCYSCGKRHLLRGDRSGAKGHLPEPDTPTTRGKNIQRRQVPELLLVPAVPGLPLHLPVRPGCRREEGGAVRCWAWGVGRGPGTADMNTTHARGFRRVKLSREALVGSGAGACFKQAFLGEAFTGRIRAEGPMTSASQFSLASVLWVFP